VPPTVPKTVGKIHRQRAKFFSFSTLSKNRFAHNVQREFVLILARSDQIFNTCDLKRPASEKQRVERIL
jgi:hypothetical protein